MNNDTTKHNAQPYWITRAKNQNVLDSIRDNINRAAADSWHRVGRSANNEYHFQYGWRRGVNRVVDFGLELARTNTDDDETIIIHLDTEPTRSARYDSVYDTRCNLSGRNRIDEDIAIFAVPREPHTRQIQIALKPEMTPTGIGVPQFDALVDALDAFLCAGGVVMAITTTTTTTAPSA